MEVKLLIPKLEAENEFTKTFKYEDIDMYVSKAFDEDSDTHYLVFNIPVIPELNISQIQLPVQFNSEKERNEAFKSFDIHQAKKFIDDLINQVRTNKAKAEAEQNAGYPTQVEEETPKLTEG